jgi:hypothetical protein
MSTTTVSKQIGVFHLNGRATCKDQKVESLLLSTRGNREQGGQ